MAVLNYLVRRGIDIQTNYRSRPDGNHEFEMSSWGQVSLAITFIIFFLGLCAVEYTYGNLIATLTMIESPTATAYIQIDESDDTSDKKVLQEELVVAVEEPLTSSFRRTLAHLRSKAGYLSRFRGFAAFTVYHFLFSNMVSLFSRIPQLPLGFDAVIAAVVLARVGTTWTHIIISEPSAKYWFQRAASYTVWKKVVLPTAIFAISEQLSIGVPLYLLRAFGLHSLGPQEWFSDMDNTARQLTVCKVFAVIAVFLLTRVAIVFPASVTLTRVQASLLPENEKTIVSFDRSFGGLIPRSDWSITEIGMLDAWRTFNWNSRLRLLKLYVKVIAMQTSIAIFFAAVVFVQLHFFASEDLYNVLRAANGGS